MTILSISSAACYFLATLMLWYGNSRQTENILTNQTLSLVTAHVAVLLHVLLLYQTINSDSGLNLGFYYAASLISCVIALFVLAASIKKPVLNLAMIVMPIAIITITLSHFFPASHFVGEQSSALKIHILLSIIAYSLLSIASFQACLLAFQENRLKNKHPGGIMNFLPPLQEMESLLIEMITLGFFLLSLSLVTGFVFLEDIFQQQLVHKTVLSILAWVFFAILLWGRWARGWRGQTIILWTISGFILLMLSYFGSKFVIELILNQT